MRLFQRHFLIKKSASRKLRTIEQRDYTTILIFEIKSNKVSNSLLRKSTSRNIIC